jgi:hypothetical protein
MDRAARGSEIRLISPTLAGWLTSEVTHMRTHIIALCFALGGSTVFAHTQPDASRPVAEVSRLEFYSSFWLNLHHTLYAAAWATRPEAGTLRARAGGLPSPLDAALSPEERRAWDAAVEYYNRELANRDLLFDQRLSRMKPFLARGDIAAMAVGDDLRRVLREVEPVYRRHYWQKHDAINRAWIDETVKGLREIGGEVIAKLERFYGVRWFEEPVRVDAVWIANRQGAYTTTQPTHAVIASGDPGHKGWASVEIVFHEVSHQLVYPLEAEIATALGDAIKEHRDLWHVVQFYLTGTAVQQVLRTRKIEYTQYLYQGLLDRAWPQYRDLLDKVWRPYTQGAITREEAVRQTVAELRR